MRYIECDRCGRIVPEDDAYEVCMGPIIFMNKPDEDNPEFDLCKDCYDSVRNLFGRDERCSS